MIKDFIQKGQLLPFLSFVTCLIMTGFSMIASADQIEQVQTLSFGKIATVKNDQAYTLKVLTNGQNVISDTSAILIFTPAQPGLFILSGFPANTQLSASINVVNPQTQLGHEAKVGAEQFEITPFLDYANYTTNAAGYAEIPVGGTLTLSGTGSAYIDDIYLMQYSLSITY